jgi:hypothetical protein
VDGRDIGAPASLSVFFWLRLTPCVLTTSGPTDSGIKMPKRRSSSFIPLRLLQGCARYRMLSPTSPATAKYIVFLMARPLLMGFK